MTLLRFARVLFLRSVTMFLVLGAVPATRAQNPPAPATSAPPSKPPSVIRTAPTTTPPGPALTGSFLTSFNVSTQGRPAPSVNQRLTLDYALPQHQVLDLRLENYYEGSYNQLPPGDLSQNINEHKLEIQGTYTYPLTKVFLVSPALLYHDNFRFHDSYYWGILTLTAKLPLTRAVTFTPNVSAQKRLRGGRVFFDANTTLDYAFLPHWTAEATYHRYENFGELDAEPTEKEEQEYGVIRQLSGGKTLALSFFRHTQHGSPNDQFSFVHVKYGIGF